MKTIGYIDHAAIRSWIAFTNVAQTDRFEPLYISDPDIIENVNAEHYEPIGYILPADAQAQGGGMIYETKEHSGISGVVAYVRKLPVEKPSAPPMPPVSREEYEALTKHVDTVFQSLERMLKMVTAHAEVINTVRGHRVGSEHLLAQVVSDHALRLADLERAVAAIARERHNIRELDRLPANNTLTFWDHAFIQGWISTPDNHPNRTARAIDIADCLSIARDRHARTVDLPAKPA